jgi:hypothetical protein
VFTRSCYMGRGPRHFVVAVSRAKEHNPSRKLLEYHR